MDPPKIRNSTLDVTDINSAYRFISSVFEQWVRDRLGFEKYPFDITGDPWSLDYRLHLGIDGILMTPGEPWWILEAKRYSRSTGPSDLDRFAGKMVRARAKHGVLVCPDFSRRAIIARRMFATNHIDILLICITDLINAVHEQSIEEIDCMAIRHRLGDPTARQWLRERFVLQDMTKRPKIEQK